MGKGGALLGKRVAKLKEAVAKLKEDVAKLGEGVLFWGRLWLIGVRYGYVLQRACLLREMCG
jgi:hypothetical protein